MTMTPISKETGPVARPGDLHPAVYLVMGFALLLGVAFGVHALFGLLL